MTTQATPKIPHRGWLGARIKPWIDRKLKAIERRPTKLAGPEEIAKLRKKFAKD